MESTATSPTQEYRGVLHPNCRLPTVDPIRKKQKQKTDKYVVVYLV